MHLAPAAVLAILWGAFSAGCLAEPAAPGPVAPDAEAAAVRFVVVGDTGTGDADEYAVAAAIGRACAERGCDFIVHTGDILYDVGAFSAYDSQFEDKFERPYGSLGLPVYLVLGNHDVGSDPHSEQDLARWKEVGDRAVEYSNRTDRTTDTWRMPARWYNFTQGPLAFATFDTSAFLYAPMESDPRGALHKAVTAQETFVASAWPANATWRIAVGHHPYISNGQHGNAADHVDGQLHGRVLDWFYETHVCPRADLLLTGHDHDLQLLQSVPSCGATRFLVSGAGAKTRPLADPTRNAALYQRGDALGFWWLEAKGDKLRAVAIDVGGGVLFEAEFVKPPAPSPNGNGPSRAPTGSG
ncbi:MAG: metallophosphoesterase [Thermoplasmatota archaeon]